MAIPRKLLEEKLRRFLEEDVGLGDLTTICTVPSGATANAQIILKEPGIIAGLEEATILLEGLGLHVKPRVKDGKQMEAGARILEINGDARTILMAERTVLNILSRMSGIATATNRLVKKVRSAGYPVKIACTRKTAPGLLYFDKKAVMIGGGDTHRLHLDDLILIKDNHLKIAGGVIKAVKQAKRAASFAKKIEVEVTTSKDAVDASKAGADIIMLDNMKPEQIKETVRELQRQKLRDKVLIELSGGITEKNLLQYAETKPDIISLGALTESPSAIDMSLELKKVISKG